MYRENLPIPATINPPGRRCITMMIPDDEEHVQIIAGFLYMLTRWYNWQRDEQNSALAVARVYDEMFDAIDWGGSCVAGVTDIRLNCEDRKLQMLINGVWEDIAPLSAFAPNSYVSDIQLITDQYLVVNSMVDADLDCDHVVQQDIHDLTDIIGQPGAPGIQGEQGIQGIQGIEGLPGVPGQDGIGICDDCGTQIPEVTANTDDAYCGIASNIVDYADRFFNDTLETYESTVGNIAGVIDALLTLFPGAGLVIGQIVDVLQEIALAEIQAMLAAITQDVLDDALCRLYCLIQANNGWSSNLIDAWVTDIIANSGSNVAYQYWATLAGSIGLNTWNLRAFIGSQEPQADCQTCDCEEPTDGWCYEWNFLTSDGGWTNWQPSGRGAAGWTNGSGWQQINPSGTADAISIRTQLGSTIEFDTLEIEFASQVTGANVAIRAGDYANLIEVTGAPATNIVTFTKAFNRSGISVYVNRAEGGTTQYFNNNWIVAVRISNATGDLPASLSGGAVC